MNECEPLQDEGPVLYCPVLTPTSCLQLGDQGDKGVNLGGPPRLCPGNVEVEHRGGAVSLCPLV